MRRTNSNRSTKSSSGRFHTLVTINLIVLIILVAIFGVYFFLNSESKNTSIESQAPIQGLGNTPGNSSNYGYVASDGNDTYLANYNKIGTIVKRDGSGKEETFVDLNTDNVNIFGLNIYGDNLYFIIANNSDQQSIYVKSLTSQEGPHSLVVLNQMNKKYLVPLFFNDSIYLLASESNTYNNGIDSQLIRYDLVGNALANVSIGIDRITTDGQSLYGLSADTVFTINPVDLSSTPIYTFTDSSRPLGTEFFCYENRLYFSRLSQTNRESISSVSIDGADYQTHLDKRIGSTNPNLLAFNAEGGYLFILYSGNEGSEYVFTQLDLSNGVEENVLESVDDSPNSNVTPSSTVNGVYLFTCKSGMYYLRTYNVTRDNFDIGIYNFIAFGTSQNTMTGNFLYKSSESTSSESIEN